MSSRPANTHGRRHRQLPERLRFECEHEQVNVTLAHTSIWLGHGWFTWNIIIIPRRRHDTTRQKNVIAVGYSNDGYDVIRVTAGRYYGDTAKIGEYLLLMAGHHYYVEEYFAR